jgi:hypothetical protein
MKLPYVITPDYLPSGVAGAENSVVVRLRPLGNLAGSTKIEFLTSKDPSSFIDLSSAQLSVSFKVVNAKDGTNMAVIADTKKFCGTVNNMLGSLWSSLTLTINNMVVSQCTNHHYLSYFVNLLNTTVDWRESVGHSRGWIEEGAKVGSESKNFSKLSEQILVSKSVNLIGKLHSPLFDQKSKLLPPGCQLGVNLTKNSEDVFLVHNLDDGLRVEITNCELYLRYLRVEDNILNAFQESLNKSAYMIPVNRVDFRAMTIAKGLTTFNMQHLFINEVPTRCVCVFLDAKDYKGDKTTSCFKFQSFGLNKLSFLYNGCAVPVNPIRFSSADNDCHHLYAHVNQQLGISNPGVTPSLKYSEFLGNFFMIAQCFHVDVSSSFQTTPFSPGTVGVECEFASALEQTTTMLIMAEFSRATVSIDKLGKVTTT